jgi:hypothetical protein
MICSFNSILFDIYGGSVIAGLNQVGSSDKEIQNCDLYMYEIKRLQCPLNGEPYFL